MIVHVLTLFPGLFYAFLQESIVGRAIAQNLLTVSLVNFRDFAEGKHKVVDDRPFGGGPGMVLKPEPIFDAMEHTLAKASMGKPRLILLTPQGRRFDQQKAIELAQEKEIIICCGRYEGMDERIHMGFPWDEISLGDFVMSGGEIAAMCIIESVIRLKPGILGHEESAWRDSFMNGLLGPPQYTRPRKYRGMEIPEILLSGDHEAIHKWRLKQSIKRTQDKRPDLKKTSKEKKGYGEDHHGSDS